MSVFTHRMAGYGESGVLITREQGDRARSDIERAIGSQRGDWVAALDFGDVRAVSVPFVDSCLGRLMSARAAGYLDEGPLVIVRATEEVRETIDAALRRHRLFVLALSEGRPDLLGGDSVLDETIAKAVELGNFTASMLAGEMHLSAQVANNRLFALMRAGALSRQRSHPERGGRRFVYRVPDMDAA